MLIRLFKNDFKENYQLKIINMKTFKLLTFFALIIFSFNSFSQETEPIKRVKFDDIHIHLGPLFERYQKGNINDFQTLAPQSDLLEEYPQNFSQSNGYGISGSAALSVMVGIKFSNKEKTSYKSNPLLRLGFSYSSGTHISSNYSEDTRYPFDTLTSSQTGAQTFVDSVYTQHSGANYSSDQLRFNAALIFRTNPEARWSLYSGIGLTAGVSINAKTQIYYSTFVSTESQNNDVSINNSNYNSDERVTENYKNEMNYGFSAYIPFGVDFRIGNKREFWKRTHLFYEIKPELNVVSIPELYTITNTRISQGIGVRVTFN